MNENELKRLMELKSGSVRAFAIDNDIPYTTIRSILERGVMNAKAETVFKICSILNIDPNQLIDNSIIEDTAPEWATPADKLQLLEYLNGNLGFSIGPRELTEEEDKQMKEILSTLFWDDLKEIRDEEEKSK